MQALKELQNPSVEEIISIVHDNLDKHEKMLVAIETDDLKTFVSLCGAPFTDIDVYVMYELLNNVSQVENFSRFWKTNPHTKKQILLRSQGELIMADNDNYHVFETLRDAHWNELAPRLSPKLSDRSLFLAAAKCTHPGFIRILAADYAAKKEGVAHQKKFFDLALEQVILQRKKEHFDILANICPDGSFWAWIINGGDTLETRKYDLAKTVLELGWVDINHQSKNGSVLHDIIETSFFNSMRIAEGLCFFLEAGIDVLALNNEGTNAFETPDPIKGKYLLELAIKDLRNAYCPVNPERLIDAIERPNIDWLTDMLATEGKPRPRP